MDRSCEVVLSDFMGPQFNYSVESVEESIENLKTRSVFGRINHPANDCLDEEFTNTPEDQRAFEIVDVKLQGTACFGTVIFLDTEVGQSALEQYLAGGRFSIRAVSSVFDGVDETLDRIFAWDLIPKL